MAKINYILGPMMGSVGANTFSKNKGGYFVRLRKAPTNPQTARQLEVRGMMQQLAQAWRSVTPEDRQAWAVYAATKPFVDSLGNTYFLTGMQIWIKLNLPLLDAGDTLITTPPVAGGQESIDVVVTFTDEDTISLAFAGVYPTDCRMRIWATLPHSAGADVSMDQARLVGYSVADPTTPVAMEMPWAVYNGSYTNFFCESLRDDAVVGPPIKSRALYTAA